MNIGLYFGSFNPIHYGHLIIATQALNSSSLNEVWFVVSPQNPFKAEKNLLNARNRLHLVRLAIDGVEGLKASDIEFSLPKPSYTAVTLAHLKDKFPQHQFSVILGSDGFKNIKSWKNALYIINNFPLYVYVRPGEMPDTNTDINYHIIQGPLLEISASYIRKEISQKRSIRFLVPEAVRESIERNLFYGNALEKPSDD